MTVFEISHPLVREKLTEMRKKETPNRVFKQNLDEIASLIAFEVTRHLPEEAVEIETPLVQTKGTKIACPIILVPILRAGLGLLNGVHRMIPEAKVGHIGMARNEETLLPEEYYAKFPSCLDTAQVIVLDPMLATGGSACDALENIKARGAKNMVFACLLAAPEGIEKLQREHPDVDIYVCAIDEKLNEKGYIVPGLGDAGDRIFGTE